MTDDQLVRGLWAIGAIVAGVLIGYLVDKGNRAKWAADEARARQEAADATQTAYDNARVKVQGALPKGLTSEAIYRYEAPQRTPEQEEILRVRAVTSYQQARAWAWEAIGAGLAGQPMPEHLERYRTTFLPYYRAGQGIAARDDAAKGQT